mmetsp:Transcript_17798/g.55780  ORF Transcript_17798/g.55780 Transcript_17798/m.55780 type:complete len:572 (+) Transcript_17798:263-1978(+)
MGAPELQRMEGPENPRTTRDLEEKLEVGDEHEVVAGEEGVREPGGGGGEEVGVRDVGDGEAAEGGGVEDEVVEGAGEVAGEVGVGGFGGEEGVVGGGEVEGVGDVAVVGEDGELGLGVGEGEVVLEVGVVGVDASRDEEVVDGRVGLAVEVAGEEDREAVGAGPADEGLELAEEVEGLPELGVGEVLVGVEVGVGDAEASARGVGLEDGELRDVVLDEAEEVGVLVPVGEGEGGGLGARDVVEGDGALLGEAELVSLPEHGTAVDLPGGAHGLAGLLSEGALVAAGLEGGLEVPLVVVALGLLEADHVGVGLEDLVDEPARAVRPVERPPRAVRVDVGGRVDLGEDVVAREPDPLLALRGLAEPVPLGRRSRRREDDLGHRRAARPRALPDDADALDLEPPAHLRRRRLERRALRDKFPLVVLGPRRRVVARREVRVGPRPPPRDVSRLMRRPRPHEAPPRAERQRLAPRHALLQARRAQQARAATRGAHRVVVVRRLAPLVRAVRHHPLPATPPPPQLHLIPRELLRSDHPRRPQHAPFDRPARQPDADRAPSRRRRRRRLGGRGRGGCR